MDFENTLDYLQKQYDKNELSIKYHLYDMDEKRSGDFPAIKDIRKGGGRTIFSAVLSQAMD